MKKYIRTLLQFCVFILLFWGAERFCHSITEGFTLLNIQDPHPYDAKWDTPLPDEESLKQIKSLLSQPYTLLKAGGQNYAFLSSDDQYILKITKHKRMRIPIWISPLPLPSIIDNFRIKKIEKKRHLFESTFNSYMIANKHLKEFSGIVYMHLNKTDYLNQKLQIIDKLGISYEINLDDYEFILQRRGILTYPYLDQLVIDGKMNEAKKAITQLLRYFAYRISLGIEDHDISFGSNFGFYNDLPFQLDLGSLRFNHSFKQIDVYNQKLEESSSDLKEWLDVSHPDLLSTYEETLQDLKEERKNGPISFWDSSH